MAGGWGGGTWEVRGSSIERGKEGKHVGDRTEERSEQKAK